MHRNLSLLSLLCGPLVTASPLFTELPPEQTQLKFIHPLAEDHPQSYLYYSIHAVGGICLGDVNGDDTLDIYLANGPGENQLFLNKGTLSYAASEVASAESKPRWGTGASLVDIDQDGDLDLYQCNYASENQLFLNDGKGNFSELAGAAGLNVVDSSVAATFADVDNDGDLDMFLLCNTLIRPGGRPSTPPYERTASGSLAIKKEFQQYYRLIPKEDGTYNAEEYGRADYLFLNRGKNANGVPRFVDVSKESGIQLTGYGLSSVWWDYDQDGDLDLFVANDFVSEDRLFRNDGLNTNGVPTFTNVVASTLPSISWSSMGSDVADINHDGLPDLFCVDMSATSHFKSKFNMGAMTPERRSLMENAWPNQLMRNHMYLSTGAGMFHDAAWALGVASTDWSWTCKFGDLDNDGWQDLFVSNGVVRNYTDSDHNMLVIKDLNKARIGNNMWDLYKSTDPMPEKNLVFQNKAGKKFYKRDDWGLGLLGMSYSSAMGDLDNDGDLDLIVSDLGKNIKVFQNQGTEKNSLRVQLTGTKSNRMGIGAKVVVTDNKGTKRTRWMNPWTGFQGQNDPTLHFGLGTADAKTVEVYWPSGNYQKARIKKNAETLRLVEKATAPTPRTVAPKPHFVQTSPPAFAHKEKPFDDFKQQPLIPSKLSQLGPCLAKGDIDGDGDEDFFVGGATEQAGAVFLNQNGTFVHSPQDALNGLAKYAEDTAAIWFDADGDKDLDLYVVTGSSEYAPDDILYYDHLYLNEIVDGNPVLTEAPEGSIPDLLDSGSCVEAVDFDKDGDLDLFVGSRSIPGKYPLIPKNRLLRNDSSEGVARFTEATPPALQDCGMVTAAQWADLDQDGDPDLAVAIDWGNVAIFNNEQGVLTLVSKTAGTADKLGWWRSLKAVDVDQDGDLDLVAGNTGINTKYKSPTDKKPAMLYYGDFDGSGNDRIVEAKIGKDLKHRDRPLPVRGRS